MKCPSGQLSCPSSQPKWPTTTWAPLQLFTTRPGGSRNSLAWPNSSVPLRSGWSNLPFATCVPVVCLVHIITHTYNYINHTLSSSDDSECQITTGHMGIQEFVHCEQLDDAVHKKRNQNALKEFCRCSFPLRSRNAGWIQIGAEARGKFSLSSLRETTGPGEVIGFSSNWAVWGFNWDTVWGKTKLNIVEEFQ